jgi:Flp pilus assembly protein TadD
MTTAIGNLMFRAVLVEELRHRMTSLRRLICLLIAGALLAVGAGTARADSTGPVPATPSAPQAAPSAEEEYNRGLRLRATKEWAPAASAFRRATELRQSFPEAWNELGYALRHVGRYPDSVAAYEQALRLRPAFPEALEYLGEAYVMMGRPDDARRVLDRLKPLDAGRAKELAEVIDKGR